MKVHLIDGTYELFRTWFGAPKAQVGGREVGASRALLRSLAALLRSGAVSHCGVAFDHVIESFRNDLFAGYKTGEGLDPELLGQFELAERVSAALGLTTRPMVEYEADDALATAAHVLAGLPEVEQVVIASPDKDLSQCVRGARVVVWDRLRDKVYDEAGVLEKFGVSPPSIPDFLALVGDAADGNPGLPGFGARGAATLLRRFAHVEAVPDDDRLWDVDLRRRAALGAVLRAQRNEARLYTLLATLRTDVPMDASPAALAWRGVDGKALAGIVAELGVELATVALPERAS